MMTHSCRALALCTVAAAISLGGCARGGAVGSSRLTPVSDRLSDESFARDLALIAAQERRVMQAVAPATTERVRIARRALEYLALARDAYERNDRSSFPDDALAWAQADLASLTGGAAETVTSAVPMPGPAKAAHPFLAGKACYAETQSPWAQTLNGMEARAGAPIVPDRPAPVPVDERPLPERPTRCAGPERLVGVPGNVHFALDRSMLSSATREVLDRAAAALAPFPNVRVRLAGHTDVRASEAYNQALSERRVNAVRDYLAARGVSVERLETDARGELQPLVAGGSARDHARNRRVELRYVLCDGTEIPLSEELSDLQLEAIRRRQLPREKD